MMRAWSEGHDLREVWPAFEAGLARFAPACLRLREALMSHPDLATKLVEFCRVRL